MPKTNERSRGLRANAEYCDRQAAKMEEQGRSAGSWREAAATSREEAENEEYRLAHGGRTY